MDQSRPYAGKGSSGSDGYQAQERPQKRRHPLSDATNWVNNQQSLRPHPPSDKHTATPSSIPHHSSLAQGGNLQTRNNHPSSPISKPEDKRISAISSEGNRNSNRDSQISTCSTNASGKSRRKTHVGPWQLGRTIGKGASGRVRKARHAYTGQDAAIKIVSKKSAEMLRSTSLAFMDKMVQSGKRVIPFGIEREVVIMKLIEHPNIISLYDVWENRGELYLVLEYVEGGELFDHISSNGRLPESESVRIFRQMIAGLSYCHRFSICHRDLKPENILMDRNKNIKIVDFGMAALQPAKKWLNTSCGSPHYASPEVIRADNYRGDKADIWSCGVILFAMLTGTLPFDSTGDWRDVIDAVLSGQYTFPKGLSLDAQDLIWRMLQPDPRQRISIRDMWEHRLLKKYEGLDSTDEHGQSYIGPAPQLTIRDCGVPIKRREDIDAELLRNLQNLWHGITEEELAQRLLSDVPNHEKVVYTKLLRYREEQLENYDGPPIEYSTSDYHHARRPSHLTARRSSTRGSMQGLHTQRRQSQYSILEPDAVSTRKSQSHRRSSVADTAVTESTYDPFRPSRSQIAKVQTDQPRITVLRAGSLASGRRPSTRVISKASLRNPAIARTQESEDVYSIASSPPTMHSAGPSQLQRMLNNNRRISRGNSRVTMASKRSVASNSSVIVARKSASYKRNVSFVHNRKRSTGSREPRLRGQAQQVSPFTLKERFIKDQAHVQAQAPAPDRSMSLSPSASMIETSHAEILPPIRSRKTTAEATEDTAAKRAKTASQYWKDDVRKVSTDVEKLCDEAFNRSSVASSAATPATGNRESQHSYQSPATSVSVYSDQVHPMPGSRHGKAGDSNAFNAYQQRPLPPPPPPPSSDFMESEHLGSYTQRELAKTRDLLRKRARDSCMSPGYLDDIIAHLDRLMQPSSVRLHDEERRAVSTPDPNTGMLRKDTFEKIIEKGDIGFRSTSEPTKRQKVEHVEPTIRVVESQNGLKPISPVKPLTIRKKSGSSTPSSGSPRQRTPTQQSFPKEDGILHRPHRDERRSAGLTLLDSQSLEPIEEDEDKENFGFGSRKREPKKRSWFRRHQAAQRSRDTDIGPPGPVKERRPLSDCQNLDQPSRKRSSEDSQTGEPRRSNKGRFFKIFASKRDSKDSAKASSSGDYDLDDAASISTEASSPCDPQQPYVSGALQSTSTTSVLKRKRKQTDRDLMPPPAAPRTIQPQHQNWLARFLRIKPAVSVLCFQVSAVRARKEVAAVFKEWRKYGMRDVVVDKSTGRIWARVGVKNSLHIPPLSLACELHTILHRGRRANLSLARFTQEKGAKSSFQTIVAALEGVLVDRGVLVEDKKVVGEMRRGAGV